jgi:hypothetical protein
VATQTPAERPMIGSVPERTRMPNPVQSRIAPPPAAVHRPALSHRLSTARGLVVGVLLGILAWVFIGMLAWLVF